VLTAWALLGLPSESTLPGEDNKVHGRLGHIFNFDVTLGAANRDKQVGEPPLCTGEKTGPRVWLRLQYHSASRLGKNEVKRRGGTKGPALLKNLALGI